MSRAAAALPGQRRAWHAARLWSELTACAEAATVDSVSGLLTCCRSGCPGRPAQTPEDAELLYKKENVRTIYNLQVGVGVGVRVSRSVRGRGSGRAVGGMPGRPSRACKAVRPPLGRVASLRRRPRPCPCGGALLALCHAQRQEDCDMDYFSLDVKPIQVCRCGQAGR
jgi:hypothetical protein